MKKQDLNFNYYKSNDIPLEIDGLEVVQDIAMACECLSKNESIVRFEFGDSMMPFLKSGQFCKLTPFNEGDNIEVGDAVFAVVDGMPNTHMVWMKKIDNGKTWYLITSSKGNIIGWTDTILAKAEGINHIVKENKSFLSTSKIQDCLTRLTDTYAVTSRPISFGDYCVSESNCLDNVSIPVDFQMEGGECP